MPLVDLGLVPSAVMTFAWHPEVAEEVSQQVRHVFMVRLKGGPRLREFCRQAAALTKVQQTWPKPISRALYM